MVCDHVTDHCEGHYEASLERGFKSSTSMLPSNRDNHLTYFKIKIISVDATTRPLHAAQNTFLSLPKIIPMKQQVLFLAIYRS